MTPKPTKAPSENSYYNRELSWLQFNARVLQEAEDNTTPLLERLRFIGIFSNNLDEFFKVRYATIKRIADAGKGGRSFLGGISASELMELITQTVIQQQKTSLGILSGIKQELKQEQIFMINETEVSASQSEFIADYFLQKVSPAMVVIMIGELKEFPSLKDSAAYLAVKMEMTKDDTTFTSKNNYALIEIPKNVERFVELPSQDGKKYIIILDDLIRYMLHQIFSIFNYNTISAHMIKITRDAALDIESDLSKSFIDKISKSVKNRSDGDPVRLVYDKTIDNETLSFLMEKMGIKNSDSINPGGRYHNRRDYIKFPSLGRPDLQYEKIKPLHIPGLSLVGSLLDKVAKKDYLLHAPYQTFSYVVKFLREAALDPTVKTIKITIYRLAEVSHIASSLINAVKNGKQVTVQIELQARFDEQANIQYAEQLQREGVKLVFGVAGLKVHCKICVVVFYQNQLVLTGELDDVGSPIRATSGKSYRLGLEVDANIQFSKMFSASTNAAISSNKNQSFATSINGELVDLGNTNISFSPELVIGNALNFFPTERLQLSVLSKYVGEQYMGNTDNKDSVLKSYFVNDFNINYEIKPNKLFKSIVLSGLVNNIFNKKYVSNGYFGSYDFDDSSSSTGTTTGYFAGYYPQATTNFLVGATLKF